MTRSFTIASKPSAYARGNTEYHVELFADDGHGPERIHGYMLESKNAKTLADRLCRAWMAEAFSKKLVRRPFNPGVTRNGLDTFLTDDPASDDYPPLGRMLSADLKRLGY